MVESIRRRGRVVGMLAVAALVAAGLVVAVAEPAAAAPGPAPIEQRNAQTVTADRFRRCRSTPASSGRR